MTATEKLRKLLDERGVEHQDVGDWKTRWHHAGAWEWVYDEVVTVSYTRLTVYRATPEQVIAATIGETCTMDRWLAEDVLEHECREYLMRCDSCGYGFGYINYNEDGSTWTDEPPKYCPECGRRVKA